MKKGIQSWKNLVVWAFNFFSIPVLFKTLFAPWQMDRAGADNAEWWENALFAIFIRAFGFVARSVFIVLGLALTLLVILTYPIFFLLPIDISRDSLLKVGSIGSELSYGNTFFLNRFGHDVSLPSELKLYGKDRAMRMILLGLSKDTDHNVLLVGDVGVGKETLIDYLGKLGESGLSEKGIMHHRVVELPIENMAYENIEKSLNESRDAGNVILVLKNIEKYPDLYEKFLPYLNSKNLSIIATTDFGGHDSVLKAHPEFLSKFEKVDIFPPSFEETVEIISNYSGLHGLKIDKSTIGELVRLAGRYIGNQSEPQKSITIIDELRALGRPVTIDDVKQIISDKANIPVGALSQDEKSILLNLYENMHAKIVGQDEAVRDLADAMKRMRAGVADPSKPAGSFLFLGPTGVGKTYTAKILAESYFGRKDAMVRFDMSEFVDSSSVETFSDRLCALIEEKPLSLVFFDELEKADRAVHNLLLQVLDEGRLTRASGRTANFKESIIIATSNAGSREIIADSNIEKKKLVDMLIQNRMFSPEFLNRFSGIVLFKPLGESGVKKVAELLLNEFKTRLLAEKGITLEVTPELLERVASAGFDPDFGARPIHRAIEDIVENKVADMLIRGEVSPDNIIKIL
ncbi:MAG: ATP-dependent Clp protease ATP-binding subunit [Candidatus Pacebacteria bacterium]|nr:ATP-dependent Clp protease ATP-binding subunit [Candidatus Paceibacterota bacterium]MBP9851403.1 ATP-dependent Clp protease ATP-binding subunit [Candidatus Paceibacterota bacterium]